MARRSADVLVAGVSARAMAASAAAAGRSVVAVDAFADADRHADVTAMRVPGRFSPRAAERLTRGIEADAVAYLSPFENHPALVAAMASARRLWGNPPDVLRRVRDPHVLADVLDRHGIATPQSMRPVPEAMLLKPLRSGGGQGVRLRRGEETVPRGYYTQPLVDGVPWSIVFAAAAGAMVPLGMSRQLVGDPAFGAAGFRYCGSVVEQAPPAAAPGMTRAAQAIGEEFGLVGVNGVDVILVDGQPVVLEVNPRWSSSMEVIERMTGVPVFAAHAAACDGGRLPDAVPLGDTVMGKAIVFARRPVTIGDNRTWLDDPDVSDVPHAGDRITGGSPVCTVFAAAADGPSCYEALVTKARAVYAQLDEWIRNAA